MHTTHRINITALRASNVPAPKPQLIADLIESVLRVPGLRVQKVEVLNVESEETITKRVKVPAGPKATKTAESFPLDPPKHSFTRTGASLFCEACGQIEEHEVHNL